MRNRRGVIKICVVMFLLIPLLCFADSSISQDDYITKYNRSLTGYGFANQASIISPLVDANTYYLPEEKEILLRSYEMESISLTLCIDEEYNDEVVAVQVIFDEEFLISTESEDNQLITSIINAMINGFCEVSNEKQEVIIQKMLRNNGGFSRDVQFYDSGYVFQLGYQGNGPVRSGTSFSITSIEQDDFNSGLYWTPYNSLEYLIQAGDIAMAERKYDEAIVYYEQTRGVFEELERVYRAKADELIAQGDIEGANEVLTYAGLEEILAHSGIANGTWEAAFWYDFATNQNNTGLIDFYKTIPSAYLQTAKSKGFNVMLSITDNTIDTINSRGQKSSKEYSWFQNNTMVVYTEDGQKEDFVIIDENTIHLGGGDGILVFERSNKVWNNESETELLGQSNNTTQSSSVSTAADDYDDDNDEFERKWSVGNIVTYGHYEQDNNISNGKEPIQWRVLKREGDKALLISEYNLDNQSYKDEWTSVTWETSTLRTWLNSSFLSNAFTQVEQEPILTTLVANEVNLENGNKSGKPTKDRLFLLSITEAETLFIDDNDRIAKSTAYTKSQGAFTYSNWASKWWLRSLGNLDGNTAFVDYDGSVYRFGEGARLGLAIRPALWLDLSSGILSSMAP